MIRIPDNYKKGAHVPSHVHVELPLSGAMANVSPNVSPEVLHILDKMANLAKDKVKANLDQIPTPAKDPFVDKHGNVVTAGSRIRILHHYNSEKLIGKVAIVLWNPRRGMFMWAFIDEKAGKPIVRQFDFYGVHEFEIVTPQITKP